MRDRHDYAKPHTHVVPPQTNLVQTPNRPRPAPTNVASPNPTQSSTSPSPSVSASTPAPTGVDTRTCLPRPVSTPHLSPPGLSHPHPPRAARHRLRARRPPLLAAPGSPAPGSASAAPSGAIQVAAFFAAAPTPVKLCETVDVFSGSSSVKPGGTANFAIWLSSAGADSTRVTVTLTTSPTAATPHFVVCPSGRTKTCKLSTLTNGQVFELQAAVVVPTTAANGAHVKLTATMTATKPKASVHASATVTATVPATPSPGSAGTTPLPVTATGGLPSTTLPLVPGGVTSSPGGNVGGLLPSIPADTPSPAAQPAAGAAAVPVANVGPLDRRLMGTQLIALAALCAAIGIVIARFTLRTPRPAVAAAKPASGGAAAMASATAAGIATTGSGTADGPSSATGGVAGKGGESGDGDPPVGDAEAKGGSRANDGAATGGSAARDSAAKDSASTGSASTGSASTGARRDARRCARTGRQGRAAKNGAAKDGAAKNGAAKNGAASNDGPAPNGGAPDAGASHEIGSGAESSSPADTAPSVV